MAKLLYQGREVSEHAIISHKRTSLVRVRFADTVYGEYEYEHIALGDWHRNHRYIGGGRVREGGKKTWEGQYASPNYLL